MDNNKNMIIYNETDKRFSVFKYNNVGTVRTVTDDFNNRYFCVRDICNILGIDDTWSAIQRVKQENVTKVSVPIKSGLKNDGTYGIKITPMSFVNEIGLFYIVTKSRKKEAKMFMDWVLNKVLPQNTHNH